MAPSLKMTKEERDAFLADLHVGVISIADPSGERAPLSAPIWYDYTPEQGVWVLTAPGSKKGVALEKAGRFTLVAQQEGMPYKYVSVEGPIVEVREGDKEKDRIPMAARYFGPDMGRQYVESNDETSWVYRMQPERWLTVDYGKLFPAS